MAVMNVQDMNGKDFSFDSDKIFQLNGDLTDSTGNIITDGKRQRVLTVHDVQCVDSQGNILDATQIVNDMKSGKSKVLAIDVEAESTHSGKNHNYCIYYEDSMEKDADAYGGLVNYTANIVRSEDMKIAFSRDDIAVSLDGLEDDTTFGKDMLLMDEEEVDALLINNAENTLVSYVVAPFEPQPGMYCYKMLIDTQNHKLYYYKRHKITSKAGAGFLKDDLKRIYYVR